MITNRAITIVTIVLFVGLCLGILLAVLAFEIGKARAGHPPSGALQPRVDADERVKGARYDRETPARGVDSSRGSFRTEE